MNRFHRDLQDQLRFYNHRDERPKHEMFDWLNDEISGSFHISVMISNPEAYLADFRQRTELESLHIKFSNKDDALKFKLIWG